MKREFLRDLEEDLHHVEQDIELVKQDLLPLNQRLDYLARRKRDLRARIFIAQTGVTRSQVEMSSGDGKPWFGCLTPFVDWLRSNSTKPFAEWNTTIYRTSDLIEGRFPDMPATVDDLIE